MNPIYKISNVQTKKRLVSLLEIGNWIFDIRNSCRKQAGFTLIEVLLALSALIAVITVVTISVLTSLAGSVRSNNQNLATSYAQQGMEMLRHMRDTNYSTFQTLTQDYCLANTCTAVDSTKSQCWVQASCGQNVAGFFVRDVAVSQKAANIDCDNQETEVVVTVAWSDGTCKNASNQYCQHVKLVSCFGQNQGLAIP